MIPAKPIRAGRRSLDASGPAYYGDGNRSPDAAALCIADILAAVKHQHPTADPAAIIAAAVTRYGHHAERHHL